MRNTPLVVAKQLLGIFAPFKYNQKKGNKASKNIFSLLPPACCRKNSATEAKYTSSRQSKTKQVSVINERSPLSLLLLGWAGGRARECHQRMQQRKASPQKFHLGSLAHFATIFAAAKSQPREFSPQLISRPTA